MKILVLAGLLIASCAAHGANPVFMEETARIASPDSRFPLNGEVAVHDNFLIAASTIAEGGLYRSAVFMFVRRNSTSWTFSQRLADIGPVAAADKQLSVDVYGSTAAISDAGSVRVFEHAAGTWTRTATLLKPTTAFGFGAHVAIAPGFVLVGATSEGRVAGYVYERNASGQWLLATRLNGGAIADPTTTNGPPVDIHLRDRGLTAFISGPAIGTGGPFFASSYLYERGADGVWSNGLEIVNFNRIGPAQVALADIIAIDSGVPGRASILEDLRRLGFSWFAWETSTSPDVLMNGTALSLDASGDRYVLGEPGDEDRGANAGSLTVYDQQFDRDEFSFTEPDPYIQELKLYASDARSGLELGRDVSFRNNTIAASSRDRVYVFELSRAPTSRARVEDDFEDGDAQGWIASTPTWSVLASGGSKVYRQASTTGQSITTLSGSDWENQSIHVDVRPLAAQGADRWAGVVVRYVDAANYYEVKLRTTNRIEIVRRVNGVSQVLASASLSVPLNVTHRVRFEAVGRWLRVYIGGRRVLQTRDTALRRGAVGLNTFWTRAQYDNVVVSQNPAVVLQYSDFQDGNLDRWFPPRFQRPRGRITSSDGNRVVLHSGTTGEIFTLSGEPYFPGAGLLWDQVVECRVRPISYGASANAAVGIAARFQNDGSLIFVRARADGQLALVSRTAGGGDLVLDSTTARLATNEWHVLRIEATGLNLRVYLNGRFVLQGLDPAPGEMGGQFGMWSRNAVVHFDNFLAQSP
jgi:hypothetical protein